MIAIRYETRSARIGGNMKALGMFRSAGMNRCRNQHGCKQGGK